MVFTELKLKGALAIDVEKRKNEHECVGSAGRPERFAVPTGALGKSHRRRRSGADIVRLSDAVPYRRLLGLNLKATHLARQDAPRPGYS